MNYRMEIDALNALVDEQMKTNALLEQLLIQNTKTTVPEKAPVDKKLNTRGRKAK